MLLPVSMASQAVVSRFFRKNATPLHVFMLAAQARIVQGVLATGLVLLLRRHVHEGVVPTWLLGIGLLVLATGAAASSSMFVAQMAFFNRVSDARIGGTYLTMLNTLANLGAQWPGTVVLAIKGSIETSPSGLDGFLVVAAGSIVLGAAWVYLMRGHVMRLQAKPPSAWLASGSNDDARP